MPGISAQLTMLPEKTFVADKLSGPSHSKLTMSLVNVSLKFQPLILQIHCYFLLKKCENPLHCKGFSHFYSPALKKWGYTGFTMSFRRSVLLSFRYSVIPLFCYSVQISFPLNILRTSLQNLTKFCMYINTDKI